MNASFGAWILWWRAAGICRAGKNVWYKFGINWPFYIGGTSPDRNMKLLTVYGKKLHEEEVVIETVNCNFPLLLKSVPAEFYLRAKRSQLLLVIFKINILEKRKVLTLRLIVSSLYCTSCFYMQLYLVASAGFADAPFDFCFPITISLKAATCWQIPFVGPVQRMHFLVTRMLPASA